MKDKINPTIWQQFKKALGELRSQLPNGVGSRITVDKQLNCNGYVVVHIHVGQHPGEFWYECTFNVHPSWTTFPDGNLKCAVDALLARVKEYYDG